MHELIASRVLIADDEAEVRQTVKGLLELRGYQVVGMADNGIDVVEMARVLRPDAILVDIHMPGRGGIEAVREICRVCPTPIVVMTAYGDRDNLARAAEAGAGAFLAKPAHAEDLDRAIVIATARFAEQEALRRANRELKSQIAIHEQLRDRNRRILDSVMDGYCFTDGRGCILEASDAFCALVGYASDDLKGTAVAELSRGLDEAIRERADGLASPSAVRLETTLRRRDGRSTPVEVALSPLDSDRSFFALFRDVSDRRRTDQLLRIQSDLAVDLASLNDLKQGLRRVLDACLETEGVDCGGVYRVNPDSGDLILECYHDLTDDFVVHVREYPRDSPQAKLVHVGRAHYMAGADLAQHSPLCVVEGLRCVAVVPVIWEGKAIAALNVGSRVMAEMEPWARNTIESVAAQVGSAIARLHVEQALHESRRSLQKLLKETTASQQRLADIIEFLPDATMVVDNSRRVIAWNRALEEITGTRKEDVLGRGPEAYSRAFWGGTRPILLDLIGVDDAQIDARYENVRRLGKTVSGEASVPFVYGGRGGDVWVTAAPLIDESGNTIGGIESIRDITENKKVLRALRLAEEKYRGIVEHAFEGIFQATPDGRLVTANPALARILGYGTAQEAIEHCTEFGEQLYARAQAGGQFLDGAAHESGVLGLESEFRRADGSRLWVHIRLRAIRNSQGELELLEGFVDDITARRVAEQALRTETSLSEALLSNLPGTFFVIDEDSRLIRWNKAFEVFGGWTSTDIQGRDALSTIALRDRPRAAAAIAKVRAQGWASEELIALRKDGTEAPILFSATRACLGESTVVVGIGVEISERKRAEEALRLSEERFAKAFRSNPAAVALSTLREGRLVDVNASFARLMGYDREELLGRSIVDLGFWAIPAERDRMLEAIEKERSVHDWECMFRGKDGRTLITRYSAEPVELGGESCLLSLLVDVTEQKRAERMQASLQKEIATAADEWRATFDAVNFALIVVDPEGTVRRCNDAARDLSGRDWEGLIGRPISALRSNEPWRTAADLVRLTSEKGAAQEAQACSGDAARTWSVEVSPFGEGRASLIVGLHEITAILALQKTLRQQETMAAMGSLVGSVAHEVRNPLFAISGLLDALDARFDFEEAVQPFFKALRKETDRLSGVMRSLLEYGRPMSEDRQRLAIDLVLREAAHLCQGDAESKRVAVVVEVEAALPDIEADHARLLEVFRNLVENGIQHSPAGGSVTLRARRLLEWPNRVEVCVQDSGSGFPEEDRARVFEPFFSRRHGGTGLGLSIVQRVVTAHGGKVWADTHEGGGGRVTIEIPLGEG